MNRLTPLLSTEHVALSRFDHEPGCIHQDPREERSAGWTVNFVERGTFSLHTGRRHDRMAPGSVFISRPGAAYRFRHHEAFPDDVCLSLGFGPALTDEGSARLAASDLPPAIHRAPRFAHWESRLRKALAADQMELEAVAIEALASLGAPSPRDRPSSTARDLSRVDSVLERVHAEYRRPIMLGEMAESAGLSPFEFSRRFRGLVGVPPHHYIIRLRLLEAARRLEGGDSVTHAAFESGFENLSHFTRSFRRWFGIRPSAWIRLNRAERFRKKVQARFRFGR
jgi:AraC-like DNA-binding protein